MTQVFHASRFFGAMTLAAAVDAGAFGPADRRRLLLVSNNTDIPEISVPLDETPGFAALRDRFDDVRSWNEIIAPLHPSDWKARAIETPMLGRLLQSHLGVGEVDELVLESVIVSPARTLPGLFKDCSLTIYSDGLMAHSPTRDVLPGEISARITRLIHLDLVPGLTPLLLTEHGVPAEALPVGAFRRVVDQVATAEPGDVAGDAVILGQYLASLGILTVEEEAGLHAAMLGALVARGHRRVIFKPHPAAGRRQSNRLKQVAAGLGAELVVAAEDSAAEVLFAKVRPALVVSCFSTALVTARRYFGLPVATMGTELLLQRLTPYENSNRIPVTIIDASLPRLGADGSLSEPPPVDLEALIDAVAYCMQSAAHPGLRETAAAYVRDNGPERYFKKRRLEALGLAGPPQPRSDSRLRRLMSR
ncbi:polysialyltransferase family glycosyltransferase [Microbispora sp. NPDC049125]|uniref:polysialyltransferase family glycosyltransferase n=1 Tax=Microbispora sp. NPDC049125 TaxID=3154929 RepID=UPI003465A73E